jgi:hypothetical protein
VGASFPIVQNWKAAYPQQMVTWNAEHVGELAPHRNLGQNGLAFDTFYKLQAHYEELDYALLDLAIGRNFVLADLIALAVLSAFPLTHPTRTFETNYGSPPAYPHVHHTGFHVPTGQISFGLSRRLASLPAPIEGPRSAHLTKWN